MTKTEQNIINICEEYFYKALEELYQKTLKIERLRTCQATVF